MSKPTSYSEKEKIFLETLEWVRTHMLWTSEHNTDICAEIFARTLGKFVDEDFNYFITTARAFVSAKGYDRNSLVYNENDFEELQNMHVEAIPTYQASDFIMNAIIKAAKEKGLKWGMGKTPGSGKFSLSIGERRYRVTVVRDKEGEESRRNADNLPPGELDRRLKEVGATVTTSQLTGEIKTTK